MSKPIFVAISDIHFNLNNLTQAKCALSKALNRAYALKIPLVIAGDLNDTKAIIRAEVANALIDLFTDRQVPTYVLVGNHDLINEKGVGHGLNFLRPYVTLIQAPCDPIKLEGTPVYLLPYQSDQQAFLDITARIPNGSILVAHQGFRGASMGDYVVDHSSVDPASVAHLNVISGHYHRHQTVGTVTYIGSPFTMTFGEANDGDKGFLVVHDDGSFDRIILDLRRHVIMDSAKGNIGPVRRGDIAWVKLRGPKMDLDSIKKSDIADILGTYSFKLDKIPTGDDFTSKEVNELADLKGPVILDRLIDKVAKTDSDYIKALWRKMIT